jgi:hypothetical protein
LAGPKGRIVLVDTENGRGSIFADLIPGSYNTLRLDAPFSPDRYQQAIVTAEASSDVVVVDSMSHEWSGEGGVLDWADAELERMGGGDNNKMRSWIKPKMAHKLMVQRLLRCAVPLICCLRGEEKTHITKPENGQKGKVITDEFSSPLFDPRFIFEMLLNFETVSKPGKDGNLEGGFVIARKVTHPSISALLPSPSDQISVSTGEALARWCNAPGSASDSASSSPKDESAEVKAEVWRITQDKHFGSRKKLRQWLVDEMIIAPDDNPETFTLANWQAVLKATQLKVIPDNIP